jgi:hypothetical protein
MPALIVGKEATIIIRKIKQDLENEKDKDR